MTYEQRREQKNQEARDSAAAGTPTGAGAADGPEGLDHPQRPDRPVGVGETGNAAGPAPAPAETQLPAKPDHAPDAAAGRPPGHTAPSGPARLIPQEESDKLNQRLQDALGTFVDEPRHSVEEAAGVLEEATKHVTRALSERPRALRASWGGDSSTSATAGSDTEDLRLALQNYREVTEQLLRI